MGVIKLWQLLEDYEEGGTVSLSQCAGEKWAVDLSGWMVPARTAITEQKGVSAGYSMVRTIFYRALCLLKHGIQPVFVMDGRTAPEVKSQTLQERSQKSFTHTKEIANDRTGLQSNNSVCEAFLKALGVQVITSMGEAEKTCALLNCQGIVDACFSEDSDIFLYGATTVYRNLETTKEKVEKHTASGIEAKLQVTSRDLVVMALLGGCDYGGGVKGIGPKKALQLIQAVKGNCPDVLSRVCGWREGEQVQSLEQQRQQLSAMPKEKHCTQCSHPGKKVQHKSAGCSVCSTSKDCKSDSGIQCDCDYDVKQRQLAPYLTELDIRHKALLYSTFPDKELVKEYTEGRDAALEISEVKVTLPQWDSLLSLLRLKSQDVMKSAIPVLLHMHLHGTVALSQAQPLSILKECRRNFVSCYSVRWERFDFDKWTYQPSCSVEQTPPSKQDGSSDPYIVAVPCDLFDKAYPHLVETYKNSCCTKKGKRPIADESQAELTGFFKVTKAKRVLKYETESPN